LFDVGCYPISSARYYFKDEPVSIYARGELHPEQGVDISVGAVMEFRNGRALLDCGFTLPYRTDLELVGDKGRIYFPRAWQPHEEASLFFNDDELRLPPSNHYVEMFEHFSLAVLSDSKLLLDGRDALHQMKALDVTHRSLRSGKVEPV